MKATPARRPVTRHKMWPCIFATPQVRGYLKDVDERWYRAYQEVYKTKPRFGDYRNLWKAEHCRTLNPGGSVYCPYAPTDCVITYWKVVQLVTAERRATPAGYFAKAARYYAIVRADRKPLSRDTIRTDVQEGPRDAAASGRDPVAGSALRREDDRPTRIGELLRALDPRSREGRAPDGTASQE